MLIDLSAVVILGVLSGALLAEGMLLVPHWRALQPADFTDLHHGFAPRLYRFFAPLTALAVSVAVADGVAHALAHASPGLWPAVGAAICATSLLVFYGGYFKAANIRLPLTAASGNQPELASELARWQRVHNIRTAISLLAFVLATVCIAS